MSQYMLPTAGLVQVGYAVAPTSSDIMQIQWDTDAYDMFLIIGYLGIDFTSYTVTNTAYITPSPTYTTLWGATQSISNITPATLVSNVSYRLGLMPNALDPNGLAKSSPIQILMTRFGAGINAFLYQHSSTFAHGAGTYGVSNQGSCFIGTATKLQYLEFNTGNARLWNQYCQLRVYGVSKSLLG